MVQPLFTCHRFQPSGRQCVFRLAGIFGSDGDVYLISPTQGRYIRLTYEATFYEGENGRAYHRLSWSFSGWLAFAAIKRRGRQVRSELFVVPVGEPGCQTAPVWTDSVMR